MIDAIQDAVMISAAQMGRADRDRKENGRGTQDVSKHGFHALQALSLLHER